MDVMAAEGRGIGPYLWQRRREGGVPSLDLDHCPMGNMARDITPFRVEVDGSMPAFIAILFINSKIVCWVLRELVCLAAGQIMYIKHDNPLG